MGAISVIPSVRLSIQLNRWKGSNHPLRATENVVVYFSFLRLVRDRRPCLHPAAYIESVPNRGSPPAILLRESHRNPQRLPATKLKNRFSQRGPDAHLRWHIRYSSWACSAGEQDGLSMQFLTLESTGILPPTVAVLATGVISALMVRQTFAYSFATWRFQLRGEAIIRSAVDIGWMRNPGGRPTGAWWCWTTRTVTPGLCCRRRCRPTPTTSTR